MNSLIENTLDICDLTLQGVDTISCLLVLNTVSVERSGLTSHIRFLVKKKKSLPYCSALVNNKRQRDIYLSQWKIKKQIMVSKKQCGLYFIHDIISTISL